MDEQSRIRELLLEQLQQKNAHASLDDALDGLEFHDVGIRPEGLPHSIWELVEHIRIAQHDILTFSRDADNYQPLNWPDDYWPPSPQPEDENQWKQAIKAIHSDRKEMARLIKDPSNDLLKPIEHGDGQTLFREAMLIVDHNAYHLGQIIQVRRLLGNW